MSFELPARHTGTARAVALIFVFALLRFAVSWFFPATIDEAYAITVSRAWSLSYYDHPPVGFTLARIMVWLTGSESVFLARVPFILIGAASAWLIYDVTRIAYDGRAAIWALAWYSVAPFFFISAGHFVVPDGPLNFFLLVTLRLVLPDLLAPESGLRARRWLPAGVAFGLALATKYQAVLFGLSALGFLVASAPHRSILKSPLLWSALALALPGLLPVVIWNTGNDWASIAFQAGRAGGGTLSIYPANFIVTLLGQMAYVLPGVWLAIAIMAFSAGGAGDRDRRRLFAWLALLPPALFLAIALLSRDSLPHWSMSGFLFGFPLAGRWCAGLEEKWRKFNLVTWRVSAFFIPALALAVALHSQTGWATRYVYAEPPRNDMGWELLTWTALSEAWPELGNAPAAVVKNWTVASKAGHTLGPDVAIVPAADPRHFRYLGPPRGRTAVALEPYKPGERRQAEARMVQILQSAGYRPAGEPVIIRQESAGYLRFEILAVPAEKAD